MRRLGADYRGIRVRTTGLPTAGQATLVAGTVTVSNAYVQAGDLIFVSRDTSGGTAGHLNCPDASITAGTSFVINSSSGTDTSTVNWVIMRPENIV